MELRFPLIINICRLLFNGERTVSSDDLHTGFYLFMQKYFITDPGRYALW
jgi:hypothetical protein